MDAYAGHLYRSGDSASREGGIPRDILPTHGQALPIDRACSKSKPGADVDATAEAAGWKEHLQLGKRKGCTMEIETNNMHGAMNESIDKLSAAVSLLERTVAFLEQRDAAMNGDVQKIVAAVEQGAEFSQREVELERK